MQPDFDGVTQEVDPQRREQERRSEARRRKVLRAHPDTGRYILAMSDEPTAETAFGRGEAWQRWVAELAREAFPDGVFLFNRRRGHSVAGSVDIVAVLPTGVWLVDMRRFDGARVEVRHAKTPEGRRDYLIVDDDDRSDVLDDVDQQTAAVATAIRDSGFDGPEPTSVLCLVDVDPGWRGHAAAVGDVLVTKARPMMKLLAGGPEILDSSDIASLGLALDRALARQHPGH